MVVVLPSPSSASSGPWLPLDANLDQPAASDMPLIACDLDDVLAQTNLRVAEIMGEEHGVDLTLDDFKYYHYWRNRGFGSVDETMAKVRSMYARSLFRDTLPLPGALEALQGLKMDRPDLKLVVVTARGEAERESSQTWLDRHFPGIFDAVHFTGSFTHADQDGEGGLPLSKYSQPMKKSDVLLKLGASVLIDDSLENAFDISQNTSLPILLFSNGRYEWNHRISERGDHVTYEEALATGRQDDGIIRDEDLPARIVRVNGWKEVISWLQKNLS